MNLCLLPTWPTNPAEFDGSAAVEHTTTDLSSARGLRYRGGCGAGGGGFRVSMHAGKHDHTRPAKSAVCAAAAVHEAPSSAKADSLAGVA